MKAASEAAQMHAAQMHAAEMHAAHVQAAEASQSAPAKPVKAAATEAVRPTATTMEAAAEAVKTAAPTVEATTATVEATAAEAARQGRRCAYYKGQQNGAQSTCSPHNAPPRKARLCLVVNQTPRLLIVFRRSAAFEIEGSIKAALAFHVRM